MRDITNRHFSFEKGFYQDRPTDLNLIIHFCLFDGSAKTVRDKVLKLTVFEGETIYNGHKYRYMLKETHRTAKGWKYAKVVRVY